MHSSNLDINETKLSPVHTSLMRRNTARHCWEGVGGFQTQYWTISLRRLDRTWHRLWSFCAT